MPRTKAQQVFAYLFHFLADGIYPKVRHLISTIDLPRNIKEKLFCKQQEGARKAIEHLFGVVFKRFQIPYRPLRLYLVSDMDYVVKTCAILIICAVKSPEVFTLEREFSG